MRIDYLGSISLSEFYVKTTFILEQVEQSSFKTTPTKVENNTVNFDQSMTINVSAKEIKNMSILMEVFEKRIVSISLTSGAYGRAIIGPYMTPIEGEGGISVWEKMIVYPNQSFTSSNKLYE